MRRKGTGVAERSGGTACGCKGLWRMWEWQRWNVR